MKGNYQKKMATLSDGKLLQYIKFKELFEAEEVQAAIIEALNRGIIDENNEPKIELLESIQKEEMDLVKYDKSKPRRQILFVVVAVILFVCITLCFAVLRSMAMAEGTPKPSVGAATFLFVILFFVARFLIFRKSKK
jgi:hypothetical protein